MTANTLSRELWVDLIGKPFAHRGRGPTRYDCYGLMREIYRRMGFDLPEIPYGPEDARQNHEVTRELVRGWQASPVEAGAGLLFRRGMAAQHMGVAIDSDRFIHATEDVGQVVCSRLDGPPMPYRSLLIGAYRYVR